MNPFDLAVYALIALGLFGGWRAGLLRSLAAIFAYLIAGGVAVALAPKLAPLAARFNLPSLDVPGSENALIVAAVFLIAGFMLNTGLKFALDEMTGAHPSLFDRAAGAALGAVRIILVAVLLVLIFDRIIPPGQEPAWLAGSSLRPVLSAAGAQGLRSLPPEILLQIERLKKERGF